MRQFHDISQKEIEELLLPLGFSKMNLPRTLELVYGKRFNQGKHPISVRVYSTINPDGQARACGEDAIRVTPYTLFNQQPILIGKTSKVLRIKTWSKNLLNAIDRCVEEINYCPACGHPLIARHGSFGEFWGCSTFSYTKCSGKQPKL